MLAAPLWRGWIYLPTCTAQLKKLLEQSCLLLIMSQTVSFQFYLQFCSSGFFSSLYAPVLALYLPLVHSSWLDKRCPPTSLSLPQVDEEKIRKAHELKSPSPHPSLLPGSSFTPNFFSLSVSSPEHFRGTGNVGWSQFIPHLCHSILLTLFLCPTVGPSLHRSSGPARILPQLQVFDGVIASSEENHRMSWTERDLKNHLIPNCFHGHFPLGQVSHSPIQHGLELL